MLFTCISLVPWAFLPGYLPLWPPRNWAAHRSVSIKMHWHNWSKIKHGIPVEFQRFWGFSHSVNPCESGDGGEKNPWCYRRVPFSSSHEITTFTLWGCACVLSDTQPLAAQEQALFPALPQTSRICLEKNHREAHLKKCYTLGSRHLI